LPWQTILQDKHIAEATQALNNYYNIQLIMTCNIVAKLFSLDCNR